MRWVKLEDFTYKDFKEWCLDKQIYGYWTYDVMFMCRDIQKSMRKIMPWNKKRIWNDIKNEMFAPDTVFDILEPEDIKKKISEKMDKNSVDR